MELLKSGELLPGVTFQMFEANPIGYDPEAIAKMNKETQNDNKALIRSQNKLKSISSCGRTKQNSSAKKFSYTNSFKIRNTFYCMH